MSGGGAALNDGFLNRGWFTSMDFVPSGFEVHNFICTHLHLQGFLHKFHTFLIFYSSSCAAVSFFIFFLSRTRMNDKLQFLLKGFMGFLLLLLKIPNVVDWFLLWQPVQALE